jgi:hypothetical protein
VEDIMSGSEKKNAPQPVKTWEPPALKPVGTIADVLKGGGGKLSPVADDAGDLRKPKGQG